MLEYVNNVEKSLKCVDLTQWCHYIFKSTHFVIDKERYTTVDSWCIACNVCTAAPALCNAFNSTKWTPALRQLQIHTPRPNQQVLIVWQNFMLFENKTKFTCVSLKNIRTRLLRQWCILFSRAPPHV
jgi:hypothetical protein